MCRLALHSGGFVQQGEGKTFIFCAGQNQIEKKGRYIMIALITGASSGIGKALACTLGEKGYDLILVARRRAPMETLKKTLKTKVDIYAFDLAKEENVYALYEKTKDKNIDLLVNNAGFGLFGDTDETALSRELEMLDLNIRALHILTKLFLKDFVERGSGQILNVASTAGFFAGPGLNTYYATKNYVLRFTTAIYEELRRKKSNVQIGVLCPGPVETEFNQVAGGRFFMRGLCAKQVAEYAVRQMEKKKLLIIPGIGNKLCIFAARFAPYRLMLRMVYHIQRKKQTC